MRHCMCIHYMYTSAYISMCGYMYIYAAPGRILGCTTSCGTGISDGADGSGPGRVALTLAPSNSNTTWDTLYVVPRNESQLRQHCHQHPVPKMRKDRNLPQKSE